MIGDRIAESRVLEGARTRLLLLLLKLGKEELGEERMEEVDEVDMLLDDRWERCKGLWLKIVCSCSRTLDDEEVLSWYWTSLV